MSQTAIILHGMPDKAEYLDPDTPAQSNQHWLPWLQKQLILQGIQAQTPELPEPYAPDYDRYRQLLEQFQIDEDTILVGHSCGGGFLVRWLSENQIPVGRVVLVAPWIDPDRAHTTDFFDFKIDPEMAGRTAGITILISEQDYPDIHTSVEQIKQALPAAKVVTVPGEGHFTMKDMHTEEFPQLLATCVG